MAIFVFCSQKTSDQRKIVFNLWQLASLKNRQHFGKKTKSDANKQKLDEELELISTIKTDILSNQLYLDYISDFDASSFDIIKSLIKNKDWKLVFDPISQISWSELYKIANIKDDFMNGMYAYLSQYMHPSFSSVLQFGQMFNRQDPQFLQLSVFNLRYTLSSFSFFIADYIELFPKTKSGYDKLSYQTKAISSQYNRIYRNGDFYVNIEPDI